MADISKSLSFAESLRSMHFDKRIGVTASCFDLLHPGHVMMLEDASKQCDILVIALQTDPTLDRKSKNKPIQTFHERDLMIRTNKYVDYVVHYNTEAELFDLLVALKPDVRIIGTDWKGKKYTGWELDIEMYWHERNHDWSTSELRRRIFNAELEKQI